MHNTNGHPGIYIYENYIKVSAITSGMIARDSRLNISIIDLLFKGAIPMIEKIAYRIGPCVGISPESLMIMQSRFNSLSKDLV